MKYITMICPSTEAISVISFDDSEWSAPSLLVEIGVNLDEVTYMVTDNMPEFAQYDQSEILASLEND